MSYELPDTSEIVPLLQIVPSKSNEERLLLFSPEPPGVRATVISRLRDVITTNMVYQLLNDTLARASLTDQAGQPLR